MHPIIQAHTNGRGTINPIDLQARLKQHSAAQLEEEEVEMAAYVEQRHVARKKVSC